ncbi:hypothetical protein GOODEAATRI_015819 [Goodea atripinnis]|uniref:Rab-GAP TBC domain-containing protein n=1 Tax=Goodea atripinnis TaxID=208336 RepID=A0ABV0PYB0_9TELE
MGSIRTLNSSHLEDESSLGSDSEINGFTSERQTDRYGFIGGAQQYSEESVGLCLFSMREPCNDGGVNVRLRCQKGIPPALRGRAWLYLSGGKELDSQPGDPKWIDVIEKDLHRQFPFHEMFVSRGGHGQQDLFRVLKAYTLYRPEEGYCQAQAPIAAVLLMHMPAEVLRVKIIFRVGLVLLKCTLGTREKLKTCQGLYETMELLRAIDPRYMQEGFLVREILEVPVTARDIEREHHSQVKRWKKNRGEMNFKPAPRMHGARLIMLAEPPRRQDLRQNPTILLEVPEPPQQQNKGKEERKSKKKKSIKKPPVMEEVPNPYPLHTDPSPPSSDPPAPLPDSSPMLETSPETKKDSNHQQGAPSPDLPAAKESALQQSTQSLCSSEQDTYL